MVVGWLELKLVLDLGHVLGAGQLQRHTIVNVVPGAVVSAL